MGNVENIERGPQTTPGIPPDYPESKGPHVEHQNRFFREYQMKCMADEEFVRREVKNWQDVEWSIVDMKIEEQATYADYVTRKTVALGKEILIAMAEDAVTSVGYCIKKMKLTGACAIGNSAHIIVSLRQYDDQQPKADASEAELRSALDQQELRERLEKVHRDYLAFVNMYRLGDMMIKSGVLTPNQTAGAK